MFVINVNQFTQKNMKKKTLTVEQPNIKLNRKKLTFKYE